MLQGDWWKQRQSFLEEGIKRGREEMQREIRNLIGAKEND
jgi:hypothetical protein